MINIDSRPNHFRLRRVEAESDSIVTYSLAHTVDRARTSESLLQFVGIVFVNMRPDEDLSSATTDDDGRCHNSRNGR